MTAETLTIERLERWTLAGAHWRVVEITADRAVVDLCACTGEPVERLASTAREVLGYLRTARSDFDLA